MRRSSLLMFGAIALALVAGFGLAAFSADEDEQQVQLAAAPLAVQQAVGKLVGAGTLTGLTKEREDGATIYEAEYTIGGVAFEAELAENGAVVELEQAIPEAQLPAAAMAKLRAQYPNAQVVESVSIQSFFYEVELKVNGRTKEFVILPTGKIKGEDEGDDDDDDDDDDGDDDDDDDDEQVVTMDQLPAAVRQALQAQGGTIGTITKEIEDGKAEYEAEVVINGEKWEIEFDEAGQVLEKEKDDDDDDD